MPGAKWPLFTQGKSGMTMEGKQCFQEKIRKSEEIMMGSNSATQKYSVTSKSPVLKMLNGFFEWPVDLLLSKKN